MDVLIIGAGRGAVHADWLASVPGCTVVGIACATGAQAAARLAARHPGAEVSTDALSLVKRGDVDAVVVATPPSDHVDLVTTALQCDALVMCEVPLAADPATALRLTELAAARGGLAHTAFQWRENEALRDARSALLAGEIGEIVSVDLTVRDDSHVGPGTRWPWRQRRAAGGGALLELGTHALDMLLWTTAIPTWTVRSAWTHRSLGTRRGPHGPVDVDVDDVAQLELCPLGLPARARVMVSRVCPEPRRLDAIFTGSKGVIRVTADPADGSAVLTLTTGARSVQRLTGSHDMNPYRRLTEQHVTGDTTAPTFDDGLAAAQLAHAALATATPGGEV